ncbi:MAG: Abi family protein, partial [Limisphaerales bacterium]
QADLLLTRGLWGISRPDLVARLKAVSYYRLSGYLHPFRQRDASGKVLDNFVVGTTFDQVWRRYNFDRRLRIIILDAIERIEVAVRTRIIYHFVTAHGPFGHLDRKNLPRFKRLGFFKRYFRHLKSVCTLNGLAKDEHAHWLAKLKQEANRAKGDAFVQHFFRTYGDRHDTLPLWMACELMTCDSTLRFAGAVDPSILKMAAAEFGFPDQQLMSWAKAIFSLRNSCAHHSRVWNRVFGVKGSIPGKNKTPNWHVSPGFALDRIGLMLTVCHFWLGKITSTTQWKQRLFALFDEYLDIPLADMGLPPTWRTHPLWI